MATAIAAENGDHPYQHHDQSLESFCLVWLDSNPIDGRSADQKLRSTINELKKFQDLQKCRDFIQKTSVRDRLILIVNGRLGREILPIIHPMRQVISIYIYCMDKKANEPWSAKYSKVKGIATDLGELVSKITEDHRTEKKTEEPLVFDTFAVGGKSTSGLNAKFVFSQLLIDCLLKSQSTVQDQKELIELLKQQYQDNRIELENINEFQTRYEASKALEWYTKDCFFYKTLNSIMRTENIRLIFLYRSFIFDIQQQLQTFQSKQTLQVYRAQIISTDELRHLNKSLGQFISMNSFFSTTETYSKALAFLTQSKSTENIEKVLFQIQADPNVVQTKPFANIRQFNDHPDEEEVLFMIGSIFRLQAISFDEKNQIWMIDMVLASDEEKEFQQIRERLKAQLACKGANPRELGKFCSDKRRSDLDAAHFERLLSELLSNESLSGDSYDDSAKITSRSDNANKSRKSHQDPTPSSIQPKGHYHSTASAVTKPTAFFSRMKQKISGKLNKRELTHVRTQNATTVAGGNAQGPQFNRLNCPRGIYVDEGQQAVYVADYANQRILRWKLGAHSGQVVAGGTGKGQGIDQLCRPTDMIVDQRSQSLIICDQGNSRVVRWSLESQLDRQILVSEIKCSGLMMNDHGDLFVSDCDRHEVRRWRRGEKQGTVVAGGNGRGDALNQLNVPTAIFIDQYDSVYVSDNENHRVMRWMKGAREGVVVAGGYGQGDSLRQLAYPYGIVVSEGGDVYVADYYNHRIVCWSSGSKQGHLIFGGNGQGQRADQLNFPRGLSFAGENELCVVDENNHRVQRFDLDQN